MVAALHSAGLEVILDVVYNHTAEGNHLGPTLCFKGIDNQAYYRLVEDDPRFYFDTTGTGNTLHASHPFALQLIMFIEKNFQICIEQEDLDLANFCSVAAIQRFVLRKSVTTASERP